MIQTMFRFVGAALLALMLSAGTATAVDTGGGDAPTLQDARADIDGERWQAAVDKLTRILEGDSANADAYNLLGYSLRHLDRNERAMQAYKRALTINPSHKGALEYQGVLFVMLGDLDSARANLAKLETLCGTSCEEYEELAEAIGG